MPVTYIQSSLGSLFVSTFLTLFLKVFNLQGKDWISNLLTTYTHHSELQAITAPLLISTLYKSSQKPLSLFPARRVVNNRSLATASNSGDSSAFRAHVVTFREYPTSDRLPPTIAELNKTWVYTTTPPYAFMA
jgi:hypothetical protein